MTKRQILVNAAFALILFSLIPTGFAQGWKWARQGVGNGLDVIGMTTTDNRGNVYTVGVFREAPIAFGSYVLSNAGVGDFFVVKYDANGNVLWAKGAGGNGDDQAVSVATDNNGNVYVVGSFTSASLTIGTVTLVNANGGSGASGMPSVFLLKLDSLGTPLWGRTATSIQNCSGRSVTTDIANNVYVAGIYYDYPISIASITLPNSGHFDIFIAKYDSSGNFIWAKNAGSSNEDFIYSIAADKGCNIYSTGHYTGDTILFGGTSLNPIGSHDIFLSKYDSSGNCLWAKRAGGSESDKPYCVSIDSYDDVYIAGNFFSAFITFDGSSKVNAGSNDIFLAKYDSSGNFYWTKTFGSTGSESAYSVVTDLQGNIYITGFFSSRSIIFGKDTLSNRSLSTESDIFFTKCDSSGTVLWARQLGDEYGETAASLSIDNLTGSLFMNGLFRSSTFTVGFNTLTNSEITKTDVFLAKFDEASLVTSTIRENQTPLITPNPSNYLMTVSSLMGEIYCLIIYDCLGNIVRRIEATGKANETIDVTEFSSGMYYLKAIGLNQCKTVPFQVYHN